MDRVRRCGRKPRLLPGLTVTERKYQLEQEIIHGTNKGKRSTCGREDVLMTHDEAIHFRDMHANYPWRIFHIVER